jgi:glycerol kinase
VLEAMPVELGRLRADGGQTANRFLMQFLSDLLGIPVEVPAEREQTALGAALLAGVAIGIWREPQPSPAGAVYEPALERDEADRLYDAWREALRRAL